VFCLHRQTRLPQQKRRVQFHLPRLRADRPVRLGTRIEAAAKAAAVGAAAEGVEAAEAVGAEAEARA
jgi:hypothetical protein